jgi:hypothetical protein
MHNWLARANKVIANNFSGFDGSTGNQLMDRHAAVLFASMQEGAIMVTLSDLNLGPTLKQVDKWRQDNNLCPSPNATFFDLIKVKLGEAGKVFSWSSSSKAPVYAYVYRRVKQDSGLQTACKLCCNVDCKHSQLGTPIPAVVFDGEGNLALGNCECGMTLQSNGHIPHVTVQQFLSSQEYRAWGR